jgi:hypothetical protein
MSLLALPLSYLGWHYTLALQDLAGIYRNILRFVYHFFSLPVLVRTIFAPWRRLGEAYPSGMLDISGKLAAFFINSMMRLVGAIIRLWMILFGSLVWLLAAILGLVTFVLWLVLPPLLILGLILSLKLLWTI